LTVEKLAVSRVGRMDGNTAAGLVDWLVDLMDESSVELMVEK
jgi:hypothetical protein